MRTARVILSFSLAFTLTASVLSAQTQTNPAGTVAYTTSKSVTPAPCASPTVPAIDIQYSGWHFTDSAGQNHTFAGTSSMCTPLKYASIRYGFTSTSSDGLYSITTSGSTGVVTLVTAFPGYVDPKYIVVGVTYAPPGPSSNVTYAGTTSIGNTSNISSSFGTDVNFSVSEKAAINAWLNGSVTVTSSTDYTQGSNSADTTTISKSTALTYKTNGTGNAFSPINSDYDTIWLWLNPLVVLTYTPATSSTLAGIQWNGYGFDPNDPSGSGGPDVVGIEVGWLNGHFGSSPSINTILARSWATNQTWPTGEGPGLTSTDIANVIANDPLTNSSYTLLASLPATTSDGRFTRLPYPPNPISYTQAGPGNGGGTTTTYNTTQTDTQSLAQGASVGFKQAVGVQESFGGTIFGNGITSTWKQSNTLTWSNTWLNTLTTTTSLSDGLSVTGPGCVQTTAPCVPTYSGPGEFIVYQDNLFGTFLFYPSN